MSFNVGYVDISHAQIRRYLEALKTKRGICRVKPRARFYIEQGGLLFACLTCHPSDMIGATGTGAGYCDNCQPGKRPLLEPATRTLITMSQSKFEELLALYEHLKGMDEFMKDEKPINLFTYVNTDKLPLNCGEASLFSSVSLVVDKKQKSDRVSLITDEV